MLVQYRRSEMQYYVIAGPDILRIFVGAAFIPGQILVELTAVSACEALAPITRTSPSTNT